MTTARILCGADAELLKRGSAWRTEERYDDKIGVIEFRFGQGTSNHFLLIRFDNGMEVAFPPDFVTILG